MLIYRRSRLKKIITWPKQLKINAKLWIILFILTNLFWLGAGLIFGRHKLINALYDLKNAALDMGSSWYYQLTFPNAETIELDIPFENWQKITAKREEALARGILIAESDDFVKGELRYQDQTIPIELRLKGDWTDHLEGNKWSFRIHVDDDQAFQGMRYFSIQDPATRNMAMEWLYFQALQREHLIALRYHFAQVIINGENKGIYAIEEHFSKELIENNQRREGPIISFSEERMWNLADLYNLEDGAGEGLMLISPVEPFRTSQTLTDPLLKNQLTEADRLLRQYRRGLLSADQVFAKDEWAKFYALADLFNVRHGLAWHNLRIYYNPVTGLLEPIAFDNTITERSSQLSISSSTLFTDLPGLFADRDFQLAYIHYLDEFSQAEYLDRLLEDLKPDLNAVIKTLRRESYYQLPEQLLRDNQAFIRHKLDDEPGIWASQTDAGQLRIYALSRLAVEVLGITDSNGQWLLDWRSEPVFVPGFDKTQLPPLVNVSAPNLLSDAVVHFRAFGLDQERTAALNPWQLKLAGERWLEEPQVLPSWVKIDEETKSYIIPAGNWQLDANLVVQKPYKLIVERKFWLESESAPGLVEKLKTNLVEAYPPRTVWSLYLDTPNRECYQAAIAGEPRRYKLRWRWYQTGPTITPVSLELKYKRGELGAKKIFPSQQLPHQLSNESIWRTELPQPVQNIIQPLQPTLLTRYQRHYLIDPAEPVRLTIDLNLRTWQWPIFNLDAERAYQPMIFEVKYQPNDKQEARAQILAQQLPTSLSRFSKYTWGLNQQ